jgi:methane/ammonia monooxygenase subunit B
MHVDVTNTGKSPLTVTSFNTSSLNFVNQAAANTGAQYVMTVDPPAPIAPGETKTLTLTMRDNVWKDARIIDVNRPRIEVAGQLQLQDASGTKNADTLLTSLNPKLI